MTDDWFVTRDVGSGVHLITEPNHVCCWLVVGTERAALIDSGLGVGSIGGVVAGLTELPVTVVNTHYHFDHVGGNREFDDIAIHALGEEQLRRPVRGEYLAAYMRLTLERLRMADRYEELFALVCDTAAPPELILRSLPAGFEAAHWSIAPSRASTLLEDGDVVDLGHRTLRVIHTPGHSPDGISLLDERSGLLFTGDAVQYRGGYVGAHWEDSDPVRLASSVERLSALDGDVQMLFFPHWPWPTSDRSLLREAAADVRRAVAGDLPEVTTEDVVGNRMRLARGDAIGISLREGAPPPSLTAR
jgi:glyoxylase-like metal-dependent hydrolase (beta-lactamase superfamily II)